MGDFLPVLKTAKVDDELFRRLSLPYDHKGVNIFFFTNSLIKGCGRFATSPTDCQGGQ